MRVSIPTKADLKATFHVDSNPEDLSSCDLSPGCAQIKAFNKNLY